MTRLKGGGNGFVRWLWIVLIIVLILAAVLGLDYFDIIPLHLY